METYWHKLEILRISEKFMQVLKGIYKDMQCWVRVNRPMAQWFPVGTGLNQGCLLSQVLFNLYTTDIAEALTRAGAGVQLHVGSIFVHALAYADDLCIIAETERDLQTMLSALAD